jgi:hypothetical protein
MFTRIAASTAFLSIAAISLAHAQGVASDKLIESITVPANRQHVDLDVPAPTASKTADDLRAQNLVNPEDALKYLATDPIDSADEIAARLAQLGVRSEAYAFGDAPREALQFAIDANWLGEKTRAYRYGADGRREAISGVIQMREGS